MYDGDGNLVKKIKPDGSKTSGGSVTKYYFAGAQRVAMRTGSTLSYLLSDHLGSTSLTTDSSGALVSELRYKPWGETRYSSGTTLTKYQYTGQYSNMSDFGLMFYNARWYDPALGRFAQADSIIPGGVQGLDRYAYVNNDPIRYTDPSGHMCVGDDDKPMPCQSKSHTGGACGVSDDGIYGYHCTKKDMDKASLQQRLNWFQWLRGEMTNKLGHNAGDWFLNIATVVSGFDAAGLDDDEWARNVDATILLGVQDGFAANMNEFHGDILSAGATAWVDFFYGLTNGDSHQTLITKWGTAEKITTTDGINQWGLPPLDLSGTSDLTFLVIGDIYRSTQATYCVTHDCTTAWFGFFDPTTNAPLPFDSMSPVGFALTASYLTDIIGNSK